MSKADRTDAPDWGKLHAAQERDPTYAARQTAAILRRLGAHLSELGDRIERGEISTASELSERLQQHFALCRAAQQLFARIREGRSRPSE
jgi:hypothetical protein